MPNTSLSSPNLKKFDQQHLQNARELIAANLGHKMVKMSVDFHHNYYGQVQRDLQDLSAVTAQYLQKNDAAQARKSAVKRMKKDALLMNELKDYISKLEDIENNESYVRFGYNKTPWILEKAVQKLVDDNYFNAIVAGKIPHQFSWNEMTMMGGVDNFDEKGSSAISVLAASLFYLLQKEELANLVKSKNSILYNESIAVVLQNNPQLLQKIRQNYYLFFAENDVVAKVYEAYEFGGDSDLQVIDAAKFLPLDCSSGIAELLGIKQNKFSTYHLASYYNEFFQENAVYWKAYDWPVRAEIIRTLQPVKFKNYPLCPVDIKDGDPRKAGRDSCRVSKGQNYNDVQAGDIIAWRNLENEKSLKDPEGYVGKAGHIGVVIGEKDGEIYYFSWMRNLEDEGKSGFGIDVINIANSERRISDGKLAIFLFRKK